MRYFCCRFFSIFDLIHQQEIMANTSDEMRQYREAFSLFDKDHDDIIAPQELGIYKEILY